MTLQPSTNILKTGDDAKKKQSHQKFHNIHHQIEEKIETQTLNTMITVNASHESKLKYMAADRHKKTSKTRCTHVFCSFVSFKNVFLQIKIWEHKHVFLRHKGRKKKQLRNRRLKNINFNDDIIESTKAYCKNLRRNFFDPLRFHVLKSQEIIYLSFNAWWVKEITKLKFSAFSQKIPWIQEKKKWRTRSSLTRNHAQNLEGCLKGNLGHFCNKKSDVFTIYVFTVECF